MGPGHNLPLTPHYRSDKLWGNTFCQIYSVGLASYYFSEPDADGVHQAYISYESPKTEAWPSLDNGERIPSRVLFRNVSYERETRTFRGVIRWEEDFDTTWNGDSEWSYEMVFDPTFAFVESGTCRVSGGGTQRFGIDLIYVNA